MLAVGLVCIASGIFVGAFSHRDAVSPLHWSAMWLLLIVSYAAIAIAARPDKSIRLLGPLFPVLLIALLEFCWTTYDYFSARSVPTERSAASSGDGQLQSIVDFDYQPLTQRVEFIPDGIRMIKMPSNYRSTAVNTNSLGYRGLKEFGPKPAGVFRIIMIGDSGLFGWNAPNDGSTIPARLEHMLNSRLGGSSRFEVLNMGVPSGITNYHVPTFATYGQELDPDLLIMFVGLNDLGGSNVLMAGSFSKRLKRYLSLHTFAAQMTHLVGEVFSTLDLMAKRLRSYSAISDALVPAEKSWVGDNIPLSDQQESRFNTFASVYLDNLERIYRLASKLNIDFVTIQQPSMRLGLYLGQNLSALDVERKQSFMTNTPLFWREGTETYDAIVQRGSERARKYGGSHFGLSDIFVAHKGPMVQGRFVAKPADAIFVTDAHYSGYGLNLIANRVFELIEPRIRLHRSLNMKKN